jgi:hypothetical protein
VGVGAGVGEGVGVGCCVSVGVGVGLGVGVGVGVAEVLTERFRTLFPPVSQEPTCWAWMPFTVKVIDVPSSYGALDGFSIRRE